MARLAKWEYKVMPLKTKVRIDHFATEKKPTIESVQNELNILGLHAHACMELNSR